MDHETKPAGEQPALFDVGALAPAGGADAAGSGAPPGAGGGKVRLRTAVRDQIEYRAAALDELLPADHRARAVWDHVCSLDLSPLTSRMRCVEHRPGHPAADPKILMALWLYATLDAVGSARRLERLCGENVVYQWICGGVSVNHHTLADFRTADADFLDGLLTRSAAVLVHEGLVEMTRVSLDGLRVRADAGAASFRRRKTLAERHAEAQEQVRTLRAEFDADPAGADRRSSAARRRAAEDRAGRLKRALEQMAGLEAKRGVSDKPAADKPAADKPAADKPAADKPAADKPAADKPAADKPAAEPKAGKGKTDPEPRVSSTDPDARVMKMADGGYRPAFNVQIAADAPSQVIVAVDVVNSAGDTGRLAPMVRRLADRHGAAPAELLADAGFVKMADVDAAAAAGVTVYMPVMPPRGTRGPFEPARRDSPAVAAWRVRMGTGAAREIYRQRAAVSECVNAAARNRGLQRFNVRGLAKARCVALWYALAHNLVRAAALRAAAAAAKATRPQTQGETAGR